MICDIVTEELGASTRKDLYPTDKNSDFLVVLTESIENNHVPNREQKRAADVVSHEKNKEPIRKKAKADVGESMVGGENESDALSDAEDSIDLTHIDLQAGDSLVAESDLEGADDGSGDLVLDSSTLNQLQTEVIGSLPNAVSDGLDGAEISVKVATNKVLTDGEVSSNQPKVLPTVVAEGGKNANNVISSQRLDDVVVQKSTVSNAAPDAEQLLATVLASPSGIASLDGSVATTEAVSIDSEAFVGEVYDGKTLNVEPEVVLENLPVDAQPVAAVTGCDDLVMEHFSGSDGSNEGRRDKELMDSFRRVNGLDAAIGQSDLSKTAAFGVDSARIDARGAFDGMLNRAERFQEFVQKLDQHLITLTSGNDKSMTIALTPPNLGRVTLTCHQTGSDLGIEIVAENNQVRGMLTEYEGIIRDIISNNGYKLEGFDVRTQDDGGGGHFSRMFDDKSAHHGEDDENETVVTEFDLHRKLLAGGNDSGSVWFVA